MELIQVMELPGSPVERYGIDGFFAERKFLVPWKQRVAFARHFLGEECANVVALHSQGETEKQAYAGRCAYPGRPQALVVQIVVEPDERSTHDVAHIERPASTLAEYESFAVAVVRYSTTGGWNANR